MRANFGRKGDLVIDGVPVGRQLAEPGPVPPAERGSIVVVLATDAPLLDRGLGRLARRAALGLARTGSIAGHGSGEAVIAFCANPDLRIPHEPATPVLALPVLADDDRGPGPSRIDALFRAVVEAVEEAVLDSLFRAETVVGRDGNASPALPLDRVADLLRAAGRIS